MMVIRAYGRLFITPSALGQAAVRMDGRHYEQTAVRTDQYGARTDGHNSVINVESAYS